MRRCTGSDPGGRRTIVERGERAARRSLRAQIARLERELADAFVTAFPMGGLDSSTHVAATATRGCSTSASSSGSVTSWPSACAPPG